ncbi:nitroreductase family protein [Dechloromonas denitrificans]|uniref:nitroreductase family protein n=1 Tax=Dechloromonas denitrificans TaxID=281362 RepID=UPI0009F974BC|nr:nitroreductase family protein [Dechloromonas denitrificans]
MNRDTLVQILDLARWAPSGDNTQPWRFEIVTDNHIAIHGYDTRDHVIYDFEGRPSQMAHGALLETLRIAASGFQISTEWQVRPRCAENAPIYDVLLTPKPDLPADPLLPYIEQRVVQRRPMRTTPLSYSQRESLANAAGPNYSVQFFEHSRDRLQVASLLWDNAYIRLTCPEAFPVHRDIIEWGVRFSKDRLPEEAIGVDPLTAKLMKWVMASWKRVEFFNHYLMGTIAPRIQLDFIPAMACAAHLLLRPRRPPITLEDYVESGIAMQRIWLTATANALYLQPEMTPVIFRWYAKAAREISADSKINDAVSLLASRFDALVGVSPVEPFAFFCRVGRSAKPWSRSLRKDLSQLMVNG